MTIDSASENDQIWQYVIDSGNGIWLGASDAGTEGEWNWLDGAAESSEKFWSGGKFGARVDGKYTSEMTLSDGLAEHYLRMTLTGTWNDSGDSFAYIIEWNADEVLDVTEALTYTIQSRTVTGAFAIDADIGVISVADESMLDYETNPTHTLTIRITDVDNNILEKNFTVALTDLADDASWTVPIAQATVEDTSFTFSSAGGNAIELTSGKPVGQPVSASLNVSNGTLTLNGTAGITFLDGTSDGAATLVIFGTELAINTALNGLSYNPGENYHGSDSLTVTTGSTDTTEASLYSRFEFENGVIADQSGNGNNASLPGGSSDPVLDIDSERGDVFNFDGDDKLTITNGTQGLGGELTIASWVNLNASESDNVVISLADEFYIELDNHNSTPNFGVSVVAFGTGQSTAFGDKIDVAGDGWHHLAATFSETNNEASFYVDGVLMRTFTPLRVPDWGNYPTQDIAIGSLVGSQPGSVLMAGSLDDVRIYNAVLTETEVVLMMGHQGYDAETVSITVDPIADTPSISSTTTDEDTQSTTGLVITRNTADGVEVSHNQITGISDGTLYKNDGVTQVTNGSFITIAEGNAGLKFTPSTDFNGTANFNVQA